MENALSFGVDIGGSRTKVALVARSGQVVAKEIISMADCGRSENYPQFVASLCECILRIYSQAGRPDIKGIGIGAPNANRAGQMVAPINLWQNGQLAERVFSIADDVCKHLKNSNLSRIDVRITNDVNAAALGELHFGAARNMKNFVVVAIGTGLGGGIVLNGRLVEGACGRAGELGHLNAVANGRLCNCGLRGCLESYVSARGICKTYGELSKRSFSDLSVRDIHQAALEGDSTAIETFRRTGEILGRKLADVVEMLDPEAIFLTGGIAKAGDLLLDSARKSFNESLPEQYDAELKLSKINDDFAAARGAAAMFFDNY